MKSETLEAVSQQTLLQIIDCTKPTVIEWERQGLPRNADKSYSLFDVVPWVMKHKEQAARKPSRASSALERQREHKASLLELDLLKRRGELLEASEVERQNVQKVLTCKQSLLNLPSKISPQLANQAALVIDDVLTRELMEVIDDFAGVDRTRESSMEAS